MAFLAEEGRGKKKIIKKRVQKWLHDLQASRPSSSDYKVLKTEDTRTVCHLKRENKNPIVDSI